jgi:hypothetical protein
MKQHNKYTELRPKPCSPIEQLIADKKRLEAQCHKQEKKLGEDFAFLHDHASELILSGISSLLFSSKISKEKNEPSSTARTGIYKQNTTSKKTFAAPTYLLIIQSLLPVAWNIIQPMLITWGINKAKSLVFKLLSGKKK